MGILCSLKNINLSFGNKVIFNQAKVHMNHGDRIGLIGPNGKGKSSLFKILLEELNPDHSTPAFIFDKASNQQGEEFSYTTFHVPQKFTFPSEDIPTIKSYFFCHYPKISKAYEQLHHINHTLEEEDNPQLIEKQQKLFEFIEQENGWDLLNRYQSYLTSFGLHNHDRQVHMLSGGEQKKILLSLGLSSPANLVLWDEPTNHLDIETIKLFEDELLQSKKSFIIISHDRYLLSKVTNKILHIDNGKIDEFKGNYSNYLTYLAEKEESRIKQLERLKTSLLRETNWIRQGVKARRTRSKKRVENYHQLASNVQKLKEQAKKSIELSLTSSQRKTKKLIEIKKLNLNYQEKTIFKNVNLTLLKGQKIGLIGANGSGKTSLVEVITGQTSPSQETHIKAAEDLTINYFSQDREELDLNISPFKLLGDGQDYILHEDGRKQHVISYFQNFLFNKDEVHRPLHTFSGGEIARLQLASQLMRNADLWIFDEPTNDLDIETIEILEEKLSKFEGSVIIISHDRNFLENVTDTIWIIENHDIQIFSGGYSQASSYIEAMCLESEMANAKQSQQDEQINKPIVKKPINNRKEQEALNKIIEEKEKLIDDIDNLLSQFDFSVNDPEKAKLYKQLSDKKDQTEEQLLELYEQRLTMEK